MVASHARFRNGLPRTSAHRLSTPIRTAPHGPACNLTHAPPRFFLRRAVSAFAPLLQELFRYSLHRIIRRCTRVGAAQSRRCGLPKLSALFYRFLRLFRFPSPFGRQRQFPQDMSRFRCPAPFRAQTGRTSELPFPLAQTRGAVKLWESLRQSRRIYSELRKLHTFKVSSIQLRCATVFQLRFATIAQ